MVGMALILSVASACTAFTVTESKIFLTLRLLITKKSSFFGKLLSCGFCLGFWTSAIIEVILLPNIINIPVLGHIVTWLFMSWLSGAQWAIMNFLFKIAGKD